MFTDALDLIEDSNIVLFMKSNLKENLLIIIHDYILPKDTSVMRFFTNYNPVFINKEVVTIGYIETLVLDLKKDLLFVSLLNLK